MGNWLPCSLFKFFLTLLDQWCWRFSEGYLNNLSTKLSSQIFDCCLRNFLIQEKQNGNVVSTSHWIRPVQMVIREASVTERHRKADNSLQSCWTGSSWIKLTHLINWYPIQNRKNKNAFNSDLWFLHSLQILMPIWNRPLLARVNHVGHTSFQCKCITLFVRVINYSMLADFRTSIFENRLFNCLRNLQTSVWLCLISCQNVSYMPGTRCTYCMRQLCLITG